MNKIIKIHGCSGAGKTTMARELLKHARTVDVVEKDNGKHEAYACHFPEYDVPVILLGSYQNNCGGMDTISSALDAIKLVHAYADIGHVVHEGLLQSTYYGKMGEDSKQFGDNYIYAFLDTPLMTCLDRIVARRQANQSTNKFNPDLTRDKYLTIERLRDKLPAMGHKVFVVKHQEPLMPQFHNMLGALQ
jgi:hypothetical protein